MKISTVWLLALILLLLSSCAAFWGIPKQEELAKEEQELKHLLNSWLNKPIADILLEYPDVSETIDLGTGVRYTLRQYKDYDSILLGDRYYLIHLFASEDGIVYNWRYERIITGVNPE